MLADASRVTRVSEHVCSCPPYIDTQRDPRLLSPSPCPAMEARVTVAQLAQNRCIARATALSLRKHKHWSGVHMLERSSGGCPPAAMPHCAQVTLAILISFKGAHLSRTHQSPLLSFLCPSNVYYIYPSCINLVYIYISRTDPRLFRTIYKYLCFPNK